MGRLFSARFKAVIRGQAVEVYCMRREWPWKGAEPKDRETEIGMICPWVQSYLICPRLFQLPKPINSLPLFRKSFEIVFFFVTCHQKNIGSKDKAGVNENKTKADAGLVACSILEVHFAVNFLYFLSHQSLSTQFQNE